MEFSSLIPIRDWLTALGLVESEIIWIRMLSLLSLTLLLAFLADLITKKIMLSTLARIIRKSRTAWDDILLEKRVFNKLAHLAPAIVIAIFAKGIFIDFPDFVPLMIIKGTNIYIIIIIITTINSFLNGAMEIYNTLSISRNRPITGYIQLTKVILYLIAIIIITSLLFDIEIKAFVTGLGAMAAVLLLIFKDTILGFVASIQLSSYDMVKPGDWISMPKQNTDGTVLEVNLNTVKVQNWDKTISTIPTYSLISESFKNWKGMEESGGRRIKRSLLIDMKSIKFCDDKMLNHFESINLLSEYIKEKKELISEKNNSIQNDNSNYANKMMLTNIGTFRVYIENYLHNSPNINENMTFLIRQLQSTDKGLPLEIYVFSNDQEWANYEAIQSDIFDHLLAIIGEFDLKIFQNPTGDDFRHLIS